MILDVRKPLFAWDEMQASPSLGTIRQALEAIPDGPLLAALQACRHRGCDTYSVRVLWGVLLLSILLRHPTTEAGLEELRRDAALRPLIGIESEDAVPHGRNPTRFVTGLGRPEHLTLMRDVFDQMVTRLGIAVPDPGTHTAGDSTALQGQPSPRPLTHDLIIESIELMGGDIQDILITELREHMYFAQMRVRHDGDVIPIDCRPRDALAVAVIARVPIYINENVFGELPVE